MSRGRPKPTKRETSSHAGKAQSTEGRRTVVSELLTTVRDLYCVGKIVDWVHDHTDDLGEAVDWVAGLVDDLLREL